MTNEKISEQIKKLNREHVEMFVKYGADSIEFKNYVREYDKKVDDITKQIQTIKYIQNNKSLINKLSKK